MDTNMEKHADIDVAPAAKLAAEPVSDPVAEPVDASSAGPAATSPVPQEGKKEKKRRPVFLIVLVILLLAVTAAGAWVFLRLDQLEQARQEADALRERSEYALALEAYARLMEDDRLSFTPFTNAYVRAGADGVIACADALLETSEGAHLLADSHLLEEALSHATHPAVPASLSSDLERRSWLCEAIFAQEEGNLTKALELLDRSGLRPELSYPMESVLDREAALAAALQAREEGRYEDAISILTQSVLEPELVTELQQQIVKERDEQITAQARAAMEAMDPDAALQLLRGLSRPEDQLALEQEFNETWPKVLSRLHETYTDRLFAGAWFSLALGDQPLLTGDKRYESLAADLADGDKTAAGMFSFIQLSGGRVRLLGDTLGAEDVAREITDAKDAAVGWNHGLVVHADGTVTNLGARQYGRGAAESWTDIVKVAAGAFHSLGLRTDGTVVAAGLDMDKQCQVGAWTDVVIVAAGLRHSVALTKDGHVLATGDNSYGQCDVSTWENVIDIRCGGNYTLGLTAEWRLLATGDNGCGQCNVTNWQEVVAFDAGLWHSVALLSDGRVVTTGASSHDQCGITGSQLFASSRKLTRPDPLTRSETEFVFYGNNSSGPWLYYNTDGCVIVSFDADSGKIKATRADLICTDGHPPEGLLSGGDRPGGLLHPAILAKQSKAVFAITGDYFTFAYNADGIQIRRGIVFKEEQNEYGFGFFPDGSMRLIDPKTTTAEELLSLGVRDTWVFGPTMIRDGEVLDISYHPLSYNDVTPRSVVASICPYHHIAAAYSSCTLGEVQNNLKGYGCQLAYNLDGGRSSMMIFMGRVVNKSMYNSDGWRGLQDMVGFLTTDSLYR